MQDHLNEFEQTPKIKEVWIIVTTSILATLPSLPIVNLLLLSKLYGDHSYYPLYIILYFSLTNTIHGIYIYRLMNKLFNKKK
jgi:hypothetical protein